MNRDAARLLEGGRALSDPAPRTLEELQNDLLFKLAMVLKVGSMRVVAWFEIRF